MAGPLGSAPGVMLGTGVGIAVADALEPVVEPGRQDAWQANPNRVLDPGTLARLAAAGGVTLSAAHEEGLRSGLATSRLDRLVYLAQTVPSVAEALTFWRRFNLPDDLWTHALVKAAIDPRYHPYFNRLKTGELLGLGDLAYAVVRGLVPTPSWVPVAPPAQGDKVPRFPVVDVDPIKLAEQLGYSEELFQIMVGRSGLSMAPTMAAQAEFRGIIGPNDFLLAIAEGDLRTEWADAVREVSRQILTSAEYAELELRGYYDRATRLERTRQHGMSDRDSDDLFNVLGRGPSLHQVTLGLARGAVYPSTYDDVPEPYRDALRRSNIRPEFASIDFHAQQYTYPSGFQVRAETQSGDLNQAQSNELLLEMGWRPKWAAFFSTAWSSGVTAKADPHVTKAQTQLWNTVHSSFKAREISAAAATDALPHAGVAAAAIPDVLAVWAVERDLIRKQLTPAQIKKAVKEAVVNPNTGLPWTQADALSALLDRGYSQADAETFLAE